MDHDQLFKSLLKLFFADLLEITVPEMAARLDLGRVRFLEQESFNDVPAGDRVLLDLVAEAPTLEEEWESIVFLVEVEGDFRRAADEKFWRYYAHARLKHRRPVLLVVIWLHGGPAGLSWRQVVDRVLDKEVHRFVYLGFGLSKSPAEEYLARREPLAWGLAALMRFKTRDRVEHKLACLSAIARAQLSEVERFLLVDTVESYLQLRGEDAERYKARLASASTDTEVKAMALTWASQIEAKAYERGMEQGRVRGVKEGLERGRAQGLLELIQHLLERRFGPLPEGVHERLAAIRDPRTLDQLGQRLLDAHSLEELGLAT